MVPGSAFLKALVLDEAKHGTVATCTFGGTSTALVRVRDWAFTAGSALPQRHGSPPKVEFTGKRSRSLSSVWPVECRTLQLLLQKFGWEKATCWSPRSLAASLGEGSLYERAQSC